MTNNFTVLYKVNIILIYIFNNIYTWHLHAENSLHSLRLEYNNIIIIIIIRRRRKKNILYDIIVF